MFWKNILFTAMHNVLKNVQEQNMISKVLKGVLELLILLKKSRNWMIGKIQV